MIFKDSYQPEDVIQVTGSKSFIELYIFGDDNPGACVHLNKKTAKELGKKGTAKYILRKCISCKAKKWVRLSLSRRPNYT